MTYLRLNHFAYPLPVPSLPLCKSIAHANPGTASLPPRKSVAHATAWYYVRHSCVWRKTSTAGTRSRKIRPKPAITGEGRSARGVRALFPLLLKNAAVQKSDGSGEPACRPEHINAPCISELSGLWARFSARRMFTGNSFHLHRKLCSCEGCKIQGVEGSMDQTNQWKKTAASPSTDDDNDALGKWLSENWASSAPRPQRMGGQVLQKLRNGRVRVVVVESTRSRRRPVSL